MRVYVLILLVFCIGCKEQTGLPIELPTEPVELYNTLKPGNLYKRKSIAYSKANAYGMNRMSYRKCISDSLRTDICFIFYYVGTKEEMEQIKTDLYSTEKMYNTIVYWDEKKEFVQLNDVVAPEIAFIAFITDIHNNILRVANPTILDFSPSSLDKLHKK